MISQNIPEKGKKSARVSPSSPFFDTAGRQPQLERRNDERSREH